MNEYSFDLVSYELISRKVWVSFNSPRLITLLMESIYLICRIIHYMLCICINHMKKLILLSAVSFF